MPKKHEIKTWPSYFEQVARGEKLFEVRRNDRDYAVGDTVVLREYDPGADQPIDDWKFTKRRIQCVVTSILHGGQFGIEPGHCVMGIKPGKIEGEHEC